jgi:hypothetical protein
MKAGFEHRVPLSQRAVEILLALPRSEDSDFVFFGTAQDRAMSNMAMPMILRRMAVAARPCTDFEARSVIGRRNKPNSQARHAKRRRIDVAINSKSAEALMEQWAPFCHGRVRAEPRVAGER